MMFRGREITHPDIAYDMMDRAAELLEDVAGVEQDPKMEGRNMTMFLAPRAAAAPEAP